MGRETGIAWTHSTFNPWIGCAKIGPGCDHCYAEAANKRFAAGANWGLVAEGATRKRTGAAYWRQPVTWNKAALTAGAVWRVFCASQADIFDKEVDQTWRDDLWALIRATPALTWQIVTKRIGNALKMLPDDFSQTTFPNVHLLITVVDDAEAKRDIPKLRDVPAGRIGVSYEPALGALDPWPYIGRTAIMAGHRPLDWIIVGGESGVGAREFKVEWARKVIDVVKLSNETSPLSPTRVFMKQFGLAATENGLPVEWGVGKRDVPGDWPAGLHVREFPS